MKIKLSRHARRQMKWRKIEAEEIERVVADPERVEDSMRGRENAFKTVGGRLLKVTYKREGEKVVIITAMIKED